MQEETKNIQFELTDEIIQQVENLVELQNDKDKSEFNTNNRRGKSQLKAVVRFLSKNGLLSGIVLG